MTAFLDLLASATLPIFVVSAIGFWMGRTRRMGPRQVKGVNTYAMVVAVPALMFTLLGEADLGAYDWSVLVVYLAAEIAIYALTFLICRYLLGIETAEALLLGMTAIFVNGVFFVLPIAGILYGPGAEQVVVGIIVLDSLVLFGCTMLLLDILTAQGASVGRVLGRFASNPMIIGMALGMAVTVTGVAVPQGVDTYARFVGASAAPAALFALGVTLGRVELGKLGAPLPVVVIMKMAGQPLMALALIGALAAPGPWADTALLMTVGPAGAMPFVLALGYGVRSDRIAMAVIVTTVVSLVTLPAVSLLAR
ncbi:MAG: AEC family transporter [Pseudomonadota bacterium]